MKRYFVRFPSERVKVDVLQGTALHNPGERSNSSKLLFTQPDVMLTPATDEARQRLEKLGAEVFEDVQFRVFPGPEDDIANWTAANGTADTGSLRDVVRQIGAHEAWATTRGEGVTIAVVDTGIAGSLREFGGQRRSSVNLSTHYKGNHWDDPQGHGSMCAAIAAGAEADGGRYDGVAPAATVLAARTDLTSTDIADIYDELVRAIDSGEIKGPLVVSNSYGLYACSPVQVMPERHPYMSVILAAIDRGIFVCFAAGNNHYDVLCRHDPDACGPNTIWGPNSHDRVISVGTVNRDLSNRDRNTPHANSSRGPGEWARATTKPDCVAPTYGEVVWGSGYKQMNWWGTSGACPQAAGAAALALSVAPQLTPAEVGEIIRDTCTPLTEAETCVGKGVINCARIVEEARLRVPST